MQPASVTYWDDEPATEQQLMHLRNAGYVMARPLTRTEAARLIREYRRHPERCTAPVASGPLPAAKPPLRAASPPFPAPVPTAAAVGNGISESTRMQAHHLRAAVEKASRAMAANPEGPNVRADAVATATSRREFWLETCREIKEMQIGTVQVFELYRNFGCRFYSANGQQVQVILDALDAASPLWDRDHPELFYQTLELNFPDLVRR